MYWSYPYGMISSQPTQPTTTQQRTERAFSEDLLHRNIGKRVTVYMTYDGSNQWRDKTFTGVLREVGRDFFVLREHKSSKDIMLLNINLDYLIFEDQPATLTEVTVSYIG